MTDFKELFDKMDKNSTSKAVSILNERGILTDEDFPFVSRGAYYEGKEYFIEYLIENGYNGGRLNTIAKYFKNHGQIDVIFDSDKWDYKKALKHLEKIGKINF